jgi:hypothetical protein
MERREFLKLTATTGASLARSPAALTSPKVVRYDGADWHIKGDGIVWCPCTIPCPCRNNSPASFGHCESTLYLRIRQGHYGNVSLDGLQLVNSGGMCAIAEEHRSALYFGASTTAPQQSAWEKLFASLSPRGVAVFPYVRLVPIHARVTDDRLFNISIPGILNIIADRNWGQPSPPMPWVAALDLLSNAIQYVQNIRYRVHDPQAGLDFDYSQRQANYRVVDLGVDQYRSKSMLIQFGNDDGWFTPQQMKLIKAQRLAVPQLQAIRKEVERLREAGKAG